ncbi:hypothetical protein HZA33_00420 [Candidatus Pacearchaeota archaeon]|nr:hypothetical protein [Candidatus Pacearchaeota archaeon]
MRETYKRNIIDIVKAAHGDVAFLEDYEVKTDWGPRMEQRRVNVKFDAVVIAGASGAPVGTLFRHVWKILYPKEKLPHLYSLEFVDRKYGTLPLFVPPATEDSGELYRISREMDVDFDLIKEWKKKGEKEIERLRRELSISYPNLIKDIREGKAILVLDEYSEVGRTLGNRRAMLNRLGAEKVYATALCSGEHDGVPEWYHKGGVAPLSYVDDSIDRLKAQGKLPIDKEGWTDMKKVERLALVRERKILSHDIKQLAEEIREELEKKKIIK